MIAIKLQEMTFGYLCDEYKKYSREHKTRESYERDLLSMKHLSDALDNRPLVDVAAQDLNDYKSMRLRQVKGPTINRELACVKHMFTKAVHWGYLPSSPIRDVQLFKESPPRLRYLSDPEIERLIVNSCNHLRPIVVVALNTGMRRGEILRLRWSDLDLVNRFIMIKRSKNNDVRSIPMNNAVYKTFQELARDQRGEYVFVNEKNGHRFAGIRKGFMAALRRAGITDFRFHDLRHTFASRLAMLGIDIRTIQELLGHKTLAMTMRYSHLSHKYLQEAVQKIPELKMPRRRIELRTPGFSVRTSSWPTRNVEYSLATG